MSIAAQLRVLGGADPRAAQPKGRPSFLFQARDAADTDTQTIYNLSKNGLSELMRLNQSFAVFDKTLFGRMPDPSQVLNMADDVRKRLNGTIHLFLKLLSPYFLNVAAHKCLEFLIRCYSIQENNVESVIECILPFHETNEFARMLKLLNLERAPKFSFLRQAQQAGAPLARATLVQRCIIDSAVRKFVCELGRPIDPIAKLRPQLASLGIVVTEFVNRPAISLYTLTITAMLNQVDRISNEMTASLLPTLLEGLSTQTSPEAQTAAYMVLAQLSQRTHFQPQVLAGILQALCQSIPKNATPQALQYPLLCLLVLFDRQHSALMSTLPQDVLALRSRVHEARQNVDAVVDMPVESLHVVAEAACVPTIPAVAFESLKTLVALPEALRMTSDSHIIDDMLWPFVRTLCEALVFPSAPVAAEEKDSSIASDDIQHKSKSKPYVDMVVVRYLVNLFKVLDFEPRLSSVVLWVIKAFMPYMEEPVAQSTKANGKVGKKKAMSQETEVDGAQTGSDEIGVALQLILRSLDAKWPSAMDQALNHIVTASGSAAADCFFKLDSSRVTGNDNNMTTQTATPNPQLNKKRVLAVIGRAFKGTRHEVVTNADTTLLLAFEHPSQDIRLFAIERLEAITFQALQFERAKSSKGSDADPKATQVNDLSLDSEAQFLFGSLMGESTEDGSSTQAEATKSADDMAAEAESLTSQLDEFPPIPLTAASEIISTRLAKDKSAKVLTRVLTMESILHPSVVEPAKLLASITALLDRALVRLGLVCGTGASGELGLDPTSAALNDSTMLDSVPGSAAVISTALEFVLNKFLPYNTGKATPEIISALTFHRDLQPTSKALLEVSESMDVYTQLLSASQIMDAMLPYLLELIVLRTSQLDAIADPVAKLRKNQHAALLQLAQRTRALCAVLGQVASNKSSSANSVAAASSKKGAKKGSTKTVQEGSINVSEANAPAPLARVATDLKNTAAIIFSNTHQISEVGPELSLEDEAKYNQEIARALAAAIGVNQNMFTHILRELFVPYEHDRLLDVNATPSVAACSFASGAQRICMLTLIALLQASSSAELHVSCVRAAVYVYVTLTRGPYARQVAKEERRHAKTAAKEKSKTADVTPAFPKLTAAGPTTHHVGAINGEISSLITTMNALMSAAVDGLPTTTTAISSNTRVATSQLWGRAAADAMVWSMQTLTPAEFLPSIMAPSASAFNSVTHAELVMKVAVTLLYPLRAQAFALNESILTALVARHVGPVPIAFYASIACFPYFHLSALVAGSAVSSLAAVSAAALTRLTKVVTSFIASAKAKTTSPSPQLGATPFDASLAVGTLLAGLASNDQAMRVAAVSLASALQQLTQLAVEVTPMRSAALEYLSLSGICDILGPGQSGSPTSGDVLAAIRAALARIIEHKDAIIMNAQELVPNVILPVLLEYASFSHLLSSLANLVLPYGISSSLHPHREPLSIPFIALSTSMLTLAQAALATLNERLIQLSQASGEAEATQFKREQERMRAITEILNSASLAMTTAVFPRPVTEQIPALKPDMPAGCILLLTTFVLSAESMATALLSSLTPSTLSHISTFSIFTNFLSSDFALSTSSTLFENAQAVIPVRFSLRRLAIERVPEVFRKLDHTQQLRVFTILVDALRATGFTTRAERKLTAKPTRAEEVATHDADGEEEEGDETDTQDAVVQRAQASAVRTITLVACPPVVSETIHNVFLHTKVPATTFLPFIDLKTSTGGGVEPAVAIGRTLVALDILALMIEQRGLKAIRNAEHLIRPLFDRLATTIVDSTVETPNQRYGEGAAKSVADFGLAAQLLTVLSLIFKDATEEAVRFHVQPEDVDVITWVALDAQRSVLFTDVRDSDVEPESEAEESADEEDNLESTDEDTMTAEPMGRGYVPQAITNGAQATVLLDAQLSNPRRHLAGMAALSLLSKIAQIAPALLSTRRVLEPVFTVLLCLIRREHQSLVAVGRPPAAFALPAPGAAVTLPSLDGAVDLTLRFIRSVLAPVVRSVGYSDDSQRMLATNHLFINFAHIFAEFTSVLTPVATYAIGLALVRECALDASAELIEFSSPIADPAASVTPEIDESNVIGLLAALIALSIARAMSPGRCIAPIPITTVLGSSIPSNSSARYPATTPQQRSQMANTLLNALADTEVESRLTDAITSSIASSAHRLLVAFPALIQVNTISALLPYVTATELDTTKNETPVSFLSKSFTKPAALISWRTRLLQFITDVCAHASFGTLLSDLSRKAAGTIGHAHAMNHTALDSIEEHVEAADNAMSTITEDTQVADAINSVFARLISRLFTVALLASHVQSKFATGSQDYFHWKQLADLATAASSSLVFVLVTKQFAGVFTTIFAYALPSSYSTIGFKGTEEELLIASRAALSLPMSATLTNMLSSLEQAVHGSEPLVSQFSTAFLRLTSTSSFFVPTRVEVMKNLLALLLERIRLEREKAHAEIFLHLSTATEEGHNPIDEQEAEVDEDIDDVNPLMSLVDDDSFLVGMSTKACREVRRKLWFYDLRRRQTALIDLVPVLTTQLFFPFLKQHKANIESVKNAKQTVYIFKKAELQNIQVAMLAVDELADLACLLLAPLASPQAALAAAAMAQSKAQQVVSTTNEGKGVLEEVKQKRREVKAKYGSGKKRPVAILPRSIMESLKIVFTMVVRVASAAAQETFLNETQRLSLEAAALADVRHARDAWPLLLSSSLLCMSTLLSRMSVHALKFLPDLMRLALSTLNTIAAYRESSVYNGGKVDPESVVSSKRVKGDIGTATTVSNAVHSLSRRNVEMLQLAALSVIDTTLRTCPAFVSSHLPDIIGTLLLTSLPDKSSVSASELRQLSTSQDPANEVSLEIHAMSTGSVTGTLATGGLVSACLSSLAAFVSPRVSLPHVFAAWRLAVSRGAVSACRMLALVNNIVSTLYAMGEREAKIKAAKARAAKMVEIKEDADEDEEDEDDYLDLNDDDEMDIDHYYESLYQFFFTALCLRQEAFLLSAQSHAEAIQETSGIEVLGVGSTEDISFETALIGATGANMQQLSKNKGGLTEDKLCSWTVLPTAATKVVQWNNQTITDVENAISAAFVSTTLKLDESRLAQIFGKFCEWANVTNQAGTFGEFKGLQDDEPDKDSDAVFRSLPRFIPYIKMIENLTSTLKHIFLPYLLSVMKPFCRMLRYVPRKSLMKSATKQYEKLLKFDAAHAPEEKEPEEESEDATSMLGKKRGKFDAPKSTSYVALSEQLCINVNQLAWLAQATRMVVSAIHVALVADTTTARSKALSSTVVFTKDVMEPLIGALSAQLEAGCLIRAAVPESISATCKDDTLAYPVFVDTKLIPALGQLSVHLSFSAPAVWDYLLSQVLSQTRHKQVLVRFAALSSLHEFFKLNKEDFLILLPKVVPYISELMQDDNVLVEKLAQDVIKTIESLSGEPFSQYLK